MRSLVSSPDGSRSNTHALRQSPSVEPPTAHPSRTAVGGPLLVGDRPGGSYCLLQMIGRGGCGIVYRALDTRLHRDLAIKVLRPELQNDPEVRRRFYREARLTAGLCHPGIPPVHDIGELGDGRPYMAMKLIDGRTLGALLREDSADLPRWLGTFEAVCHAVAFAHSQGVIHRDLKPSNVMVGAFGEVQVMDWGVARDLDDTPGRPPAGPDHPTDADLTLLGQVVGTPAYMAPEQAAGLPATRRSDVFGLGAVLCEILVGNAPFADQNSSLSLLRAAKGDCSMALMLMEGIRADPEWVTLCRKCLSLDPADRYADGAELAREVADLRRRSEERADTAQLARATAEVRADEERKRRRAQSAMAACVLILLIAGGSMWARNRAIGADRDRAVVAAVQEHALRHERLCGNAERAIARASQLRQRGLWTQALQVLGDADPHSAVPGEVEVADLLRAAERDVKFLRRLEEVRLSKLLDNGKDHDWDPKKSSGQYRTIFADYGLDPTRLTAPEIAAKVASSPIREELVAALDDFGLDEADPAVRETIWEATRLVTGHAWRTGLIAATTPAMLKIIVGRIPPDEMTPAIITSLGAAMYEGDIEGVALLAAGCRRYPSDFWLLLTLGNALFYHETPREAESGGCFRAALALRPDCVQVWLRLGDTLFEKGDLTEAEACARKAIALDPGFALGWINLGKCRRELGLARESLGQFERALRLDPNNARAHYHSGIALRDLGRLGEAEVSVRRAVALDPGSPRPLRYLCRILWQQRNLRELLGVERRIYADDPADESQGLRVGSALMELGEFDEAICVATDILHRDANHAQAISCLRMYHRTRGLAAELPEIRAGRRVPATGREGLDMARLTGATWVGEWNLTVRLYRQTASLDADALRSAMPLPIYAAIRAAAGEDAAFRPTDAERAELWKQAREWGRDWLDCQRSPATAREHHTRAKAREALHLFLVGTESASVRDPEKMALLPPTERREWEAFWKEVREMREATNRPKERSTR